MKVSLNTIKQYIDFELPEVDELVACINAQLGGVEEVIDLAAKYKDAKIVKVVECEKHPNADKLSACKIDAGADELIQVVCGAPNVHAGMWAVWLPPESIVPNTYGTADEFTLGARELRGIMSNGMLASGKELAISDDHDGIVDITDADVPDGKILNAGMSFAEVFGLNDMIIDIENKMFTHRPDLFGQLGVAREIAGIFGQQFASPEWYAGVPKFQASSDELPLEIFHDALELAPRFMAVAIKDVTVKPSPLWLQCALVALGGKPINNIVDVTNYVMLLTAQPTHAYDYDKIRGARLGVRMARAGEKISLLNGKTYELTGEDIVIADSEGAIGLAGIMGGSNSEVSSNTKNVVLEVATFDMYTVRKTSMRYGLFTDAVTRFNKGQSAVQNDHVLSVLMASLFDVAGGRQASPVEDDHVIDASRPDQDITVTPTFINERLGLQLTVGEITTLLKNVECEVCDELCVSPPFWRTDLELPEDIVEEVGRLYGYNKLPRALPHRSTKPAPVAITRAGAQLVREILARAGANEVLTYSFVHERVLLAAGQNKADAYQLSNALSPDLQYYRLSVTPSLLDKVHANSKAGYDEFALFEVGKSHSKKAGLDDEGLPIESLSIALVYTNKTTESGAPFYHAKAILNFLALQLGVELTYEPLDGSSTSPLAVPFEPKRTAIVSDKKTGQFIGVVGEYTKAVQRNFKLPDYTAGFELQLDELVRLAKEARSAYQPLSRYPSIARDMSVRVAHDMPYERVQKAFEAALASMQLTATTVPVGIYQPEGVTTKNITLRITLTSYEKTLTNEEANTIIDTVTEQLKTTIGAERI